MGHRGEAVFLGEAKSRTAVGNSAFHRPQPAVREVDIYGNFDPSNDKVFESSKGKAIVGSNTTEDAIIIKDDEPLMEVKEEPLGTVEFNFTEFPSSA
ncbi:hypothetical protein AMTR_s00082p00087200 [Amborella trichopoda]|uniref:Uncharacterized protein n=1 Tax=Amborella trichopoda TaxID=13333 RepID=W1NVP3_AMBTC|nr:hypothetical protein AMTR_s00082p00087200 [Amborella trichopoda]